MKFVSFFAGIGGMDLGLERAGHECVGQVEIDPYALRVLERHWPDVPRFGDVRTLGPGSLPEADLWCGGHPCQRFSSAARGRNNAPDLWPDWLRFIEARRPRWLFIENVPAVSVDTDLRGCGYTVGSAVLAAADFGAPFQGRRYYAIAKANRDGESELRLDAEVVKLSGVRGPIRPWTDPPRGLRVDDGIPNRMDRLACIGNSVDPWTVEAIARRVWG